MTEMSDPSDPRIRVRAVRLSGWRAVATVVAGLMVLVAVAAFLALGFFFIVLPTMVLGTVAYYFLPKPPSRSVGNSNAAERTGSTTIIDGTYKVTNDAAGQAENDHKSGRQAEGRGDHQT
jgi:hypothetical protein